MVHVLDRREPVTCCRTRYLANPRFFMAERISWIYPPLLYTTSVLDEWQICDCIWMSTYILLTSWLLEGGREEKRTGTSSWGPDTEQLEMYICRLPRNIWLPIIKEILLRLWDEKCYRSIFKYAPSWRVRPSRVTTLQVECHSGGQVESCVRGVFWRLLLFRTHGSLYRFSDTSPSPCPQHPTI